MPSAGPRRAVHTAPPVTCTLRTSASAISIAGDITSDRRPRAPGPGLAGAGRTWSASQLQIQLGLDVEQVLPENTFPAPVPSQMMSSGWLPERWLPVIVSN